MFNNSSGLSGTSPKARAHNIQMMPTGVNQTHHALISQNNDEQ